MRSIEQKTRQKIELVERKIRDLERIKRTLDSGSGMRGPAPDG